MKKTLKLTSLLFTLILAVSVVFTGCGNGRKDNGCRVFNIEIFISGKIQNYVLYLVWKHIQRESSFQNMLNF